MEVSSLKDWFSILTALLAIGSFVYAWLTRRSTENTDKIAKIEAKMVGYDRRIQSVESDLKHMPDHAQMTGIQIAITKLDGSFQRVEDLISAQARSMQRVEKHLFEDPKGSRG